MNASLALRPGGTCSERFASLVPVDRAPLSCRGLGCRPFMAETRVRIPVAVLPGVREEGHLYAEAEERSRTPRSLRVATAEP